MHDDRKEIPKIPIPCVRVIALNQDRRILVLQRALESYKGGEWCLPGGKIDYNETPEQAVARELWEETGLASYEEHFLGFQNSLPLTLDGMHAINFYYSCKAEGSLILNSESISSRWLDLEEALRFPLEFGNNWGIQLFAQKSFH